MHHARHTLLYYHQNTNFYSHPTAFPSTPAVHITVVYLRNKSFLGNNKESNEIPSPHIDFNQPLPDQMSAQEAHLKNRNEHKHRSSELENAQESGSST